MLTKLQNAPHSPTSRFRATRVEHTASHVVFAKQNLPVYLPHAREKNGQSDEEPQPSSPWKRTMSTLSKKSSSLFSMVNSFKKAEQKRDTRRPMSGT